MSPHCSPLLQVPVWGTPPTGQGLASTPPHDPHQGSPPSCGPGGSLAGTPGRWGQILLIIGSWRSGGRGVVSGTHLLSGLANGQILESWRAGR